MTMKTISGERLMTVAEDARRRAHQAGAEAVEVFFSAAAGRTVAFQDRRPDAVELAEEAGFALRLAKDGRMGFAYFAPGADPGADAGAAVAAALKSASLGEEPACGFAAAAAMPAPKGILDPGHAGRSDEEAMAMLREQVEAGFAVSPRVKRVRRTIYHEQYRLAGLLTSSGFAACREGTSYSLITSVVAGEGGDNETAHEWVTERFFNRLAESRPVAEAARRAAAMLGAGPVATGAYNVVLHPAVAGELISVFAQGLSGEMVVKGTTPLAGQLDRAVGGRLFNLTDDGLLPGGWHSGPFDDEGVGRAALPMVEGGILRRFLLNRRTAERLERPPTGHGYRHDFKNPPGVRPSNLFLSPGPEAMTEERLLTAADGGLMVADIMGAHTMDPVSGNFSLGASGFVIEDGRIGRPFRGVTVAGNVYELFHRLEAVGDAVRFYGGFGSPMLLIASVDVAGG